MREHPEWFFSSRRFEAAELVGLLAAECLRSGVRDLTMEWLGDWSVLSSSKDWLDGDVASFLRLQPYDQTSHSSRVEVVATAFCRATVTATRSEWYEVQLEPGAEIPQSIAERLDDPLKGRVLAFLPPRSEDGKDGAEVRAEPDAAVDGSRRFRLLQGDGADRVAADVRSLTEKLRK